MLEAGLVELILANSALSTLISGVPSPVVLPEAPVFPALTYQVISGNSKTTLDSKTVTSRRVQFDSWSTKYSEVKAVQQALHNLLDAYQGTLSDGTRVTGTYRSVELDYYESDARLFRTTTEYLIQFAE